MKKLHKIVILSLFLEIESREPEFMKISNAGNKMIQANHYAKHEIQRKIAEVSYKNNWKRRVKQNIRNESS